MTFRTTLRIDRETSGAARTRSIECGLRSYFEGDDLLCVLCLLAAIRNPIEYALKMGLDSCQYLMDGRRLWI